jgi:hypothetical protein
LGLSTNSRSDTRQFSVLAVALLWAILLLSLAPGAKGEAAPRPNVDEDPGGAPYVAGELLVLYEPGTSENTEQAVVRGSGGKPRRIFRERSVSSRFPVYDARSRRRPGLAPWRGSSETSGTNHASRPPTTTLSAGLPGYRTTRSSAASGDSTRPAFLAHGTMRRAGT